MKNQNKRELIRIVKDEINNELNRKWKRLQYPKHLPKLEKVLMEFPPIEKIDSENDKVLAPFEFENIPVYSQFEGRYIDTKDAVIRLEPIGQGSTSTVYLKIHVDTLALIAVSKYIFLSISI